MGYVWCTVLSTYEHRVAVRATKLVNGLDLPSFEFVECFLLNIVCVVSHGLCKFVHQSRHTASVSGLHLKKTLSRLKFLKIDLKKHQFGLLSHSSLSFGSMMCMVHDIRHNAISPKHMLFGALPICSSGEQSVEESKNQSPNISTGPEHATLHGVPDFVK
jgi:hypothetical protein